MENKILVTIARQYGSGGREIGLRLSELLGIPLYDRELITQTAEEGNLHPHVAERVDEKAAGSLLYTLATATGLHGVSHTGEAHIPVNDRLFLLQSEYIRKKAAEGSGVFIGRCADYVLRDEPARFSVFVHAPAEIRHERVMARHPELRPGAALDLIHKTDRRRSSSYAFYTGGKWGQCGAYHMSVDSHLFGIEGTAELIAEAVFRARASHA